MPRGILNLKNYIIYNIRGRGTIFEIDRKDYGKRIFRIGQRIFAEEKIWEITGIEAVVYPTFPTRISDKLGLVVKHIE